MTHLDIGVLSLLEAHVAAPLLGRADLTTKKLNNFQDIWGYGKVYYQAQAVLLLFITLLLCYKLQLLSSPQGAGLRYFPK